MQGCEESHGLRLRSHGGSCRNAPQVVLAYERTMSKTPSASGSTPIRQQSYCRVCPAACGTVVTVEDDAVVKIEGDPEHPLSRGYTCPKGRMAAEWSHRPDAYYEPLLRGASGLSTVSWPVLLDDLSKRLDTIVSTYGPDSLGVYIGTAANLDSAGAAISRKWFASIGSRSRFTTLTVDSVTKVLIPQLMAGTPWLRPVLDVDSTTLAIYVGQNPLISHGAYSYMSDPVRILRQVKSRGELWVIDPRRTETARLANRHLTPIAGSDYAVFAFLLKELLEDGADWTYLHQHARGIDQLAEVVHPYNAERAAHLTGLSVEELEDLLNTIRRHRRFAVLTGTGVSMAQTGLVTEWLVYAIQIVTGSFERPGGRWFNPGYPKSPPDVAIPRTTEFRQAGPPSRPELPDQFDQRPCAALVDEIESGNIRGLVVLGGNPLVALPEPDRLRRALESLDVLAVWDVAPTATTAIATHVLPCADSFERSDLMVLSVLPETCAQYAKAAVRPAGNRRPSWWSIAHLDLLSSRGGPESPRSSLLPGGLHPDECSDEDILRMIADAGRGSWDELRQSPTAVVYPREDRWVERFVLDDGRWNLAPAQLVERLHDLDESGDPSELVLVNRRERRHCNSTLLSEATSDEARIYIGEFDAQRLGVADGDEVIVESESGRVRGAASVDASLSRGHIAIPHGYDVLNVGQLTSSSHGVDTLSGMTLQTGIPVNLTRPEAGEDSE